MSERPYAESSDFGDPFPIEPELRELLREIVRRQEARLLRTDGELAPGEHSSPFSVVRPSMAGLHMAERQLLRCYREETAELLRHLALARLQGQERVRRMADVHVSATERITVRDLRAMRRKLAAEARLIRSEYGDEPTALELLDAIQSGRRRRATATSSAAASMRLVPSDACRLYVAQEQLAGGSPASALRGFSYVAESSHLGQMKVAAMSWQAVVAARQGNFRQALELNRLCAESEYRRPNHGYNCFVFALQAGLRHECLAEARQVDATIPDSPAVSQWLAVVYEGRVAREWTPTSEGRGLARDLLHSLGPTAKRIAHVLL